MTENNKTNVEKLIDRIKNHRMLSIFIVLGIGVVAIDKVMDTRIFKHAYEFIAGKPALSKDIDSELESYLNDNRHLLQDKSNERQ